MKKYVAVMNIPSPYRLHSLGVTAELLKAKGVDFECHFMNRTHKDRPKSWLNPQIGFPHHYWRNWGFDQHELNPGLVWHLFRHQPAYLFCSDPFSTFTGILILLLCRKSVRIAWCEGNTKTPGKLGGVLGWIKRLVFGHCQFIAVPGIEGARYVDLHRARTTKTLPPVVYHPNLIDETRFQGGAAKTGERLCFIPARFVWDKGLEEFFGLLEPAWLEGWRILVLGHGPLKASVEKIIAARGLGAYVEIKESVPYCEVPQYYARADLFLLPSRHDQNPLTAVEAVHAGLPIALSDQAGNIDEAVTEGVNGWRLPVLDDRAFAAKLREVFATDRERLREMGEASKRENARFWGSRESIGRYLEGVGL